MYVLYIYNVCVCVCCIFIFVLLPCVFTYLRLLGGWTPYNILSVLFTLAAILIGMCVNSYHLYHAYETHKKTIKATSFSSYVLSFFSSTPKQGRTGMEGSIRQTEGKGTSGIVEGMTSSSGSSSEIHRGVLNTGGGTDGGEQGERGHHEPVKMSFTTDETS